MDIVIHMFCSFVIVVNQHYTVNHPECTLLVKLLMFFCVFTACEVADVLNCLVTAGEDDDVLLSGHCW